MLTTRRTAIWLGIALLSLPVQALAQNPGGGTGGSGNGGGNNPPPPDFVKGYHTAHADDMTGYQPNIPATVTTQDTGIPTYNGISSYGPAKTARNAHAFRTWPLSAIRVIGCSALGWGEVRISQPYRTLATSNLSSLRDRNDIGLASIMATSKVTCQTTVPAVEGPQTLSQLVKPTETATKGFAEPNWRFRVRINGTLVREGVAEKTTSGFIVRITDRPNEVFDASVTLPGIHVPAGATVQAEAFVSIARAGAPTPGGVSKTAKANLITITQLVAN